MACTHRWSQLFRTPSDRLYHYCLACGRFDEWEDGSGEPASDTSLALVVSSETYSMHHERASRLASSWHRRPSQACSLCQYPADVHDENFGHTFTPIRQPRPAGVVHKQGGFTDAERAMLVGPDEQSAIPIESYAASLVSFNADARTVDLVIGTHEGRYHRIRFDAWEFYRLVASSNTQDLRDIMQPRRPGEGGTTNG